MPVGNQIQLLNVVSNSINQTYNLPDPSNMILFDSLNSLLYSNGNMNYGTFSLAKIQIPSGTASEISLPGAVSILAQGPSGKIFASLSSGGGSIELVDGLGSAPITNYASSAVAGPYISYDSSRNLLLVGENFNSPPPMGIITDYVFNDGINNLALYEGVNLGLSGLVITGVKVSPDGNHGAVLLGTYVDDLNMNNLNFSLGQWPGGVSPQAGDFSSDSQYFLTANNSSSPVSLCVYSVASHALVEGYPIPSPFTPTYVGFSRGGGMVYVLGYTSSNTSILYWFLYP